MRLLTVDTSSLRELFEGLDDAAMAAARPAAQAAAQVLYDEVRRNVAAIPQKTGKLAQSVYQAYSQARSGEGFASYHVSWNPRKAPHGHLIENGHIQRYATYVGTDGQYYLVKRPESRGKPKPRRGASQAEKDAYYVVLPTPKQVPARSFVRRAQSKIPEAVEAARDTITRIINRGNP